MNPLTRILRRVDIARFIKDDTGVKVFENMQNDIINLFPQQGTVEADLAFSAITDSGIASSLKANTTYLVTGMLTFQTDNAAVGLLVSFDLPAGATVVGVTQTGTMALATNIALLNNWIIRTADAGDVKLEVAPNGVANLTLIKNLCAINFTQI